METSNTAGPAQSRDQAHFYNTAFVLAFMARYRFTETFRMELEYSHARLSEPDIVFVSGLPGDPFAGGEQEGVGDVCSYGLSANAIYDLPFDNFHAMLLLVLMADSRSYTSMVLGATAVLIWKQCPIPDRIARRADRVGMAE